MLQLKHISKRYVTGELMQIALNDISLNLRDNEFVAVLGPSGSGKTTLLNIIGGLDRYDRGDLIINGISTRRYRDRDWDSYRNHTIGFVFQSYNLIPHQTILSNVELALTISGVSRSERKRRAKKALEEVGLGDQLHKRPNQLSGGQMQRVAIARALVNNPDILLADEPTGALDTETSIHIMDLLKEVAKDRLVVMVTHNPELAHRYATRIVSLRDGRIIGDTNPYIVDERQLNPPEHKNMGKASMSFLTALSLSFNNLRTKKARTILTSFAGSIGIIGIALILSLSTGVNAYITDVQKSTMASYPITIEKESIDLSSLIATERESVKDTEADHKMDGVYSNGKTLELASSISTSITKNNLTEFKKYLDDPKSEIHKYVGENGIVYSYDTKFGVYTHDSEGTFVNTDGSTLADKKSSDSAMDMSAMAGSDTSSSASFSMTTSFGSQSIFKQILPGSNGKLISPVITENYSLLYGAWPKAYDEVVLFVDKNNEIPTTTLYQLGLLPTSEYRKLIEKIDDGKKITVETKKLSYEDICKKDLYMIPACDTYVKNDNGTFTCVSDDTAEMERLMKKAVKLKIVGIAKPVDDDDNKNFVTSPVGYTKALTDYLIDYTDNSAVVKAQKADNRINVLNGLNFTATSDAVKVSDTKKYLSNLGVSEKAAMSKMILASVYGSNPAMASQLSNLSETQLAEMLDNYLKNPDDDVLLEIYKNYISAGSYDDNMEAFGVVSADAPSSISIYADSFEDKDSISDCIDNYNKKASDDDKISYTDYVGLLMSSVTTIINVITYVLIAFVAVSLIVSSIMIGIITYISVLERTKEIGILRAIGASKKNISQVFNAETFIIGLLAGLIGIGLTLLLLIPGNAIIHLMTGFDKVNAILPINGAVLLIVLSVVLTLIGGLIPASKAAKKDPVTALRTE